MVLEGRIVFDDRPDRLDGVRRITSEAVRSRARSLADTVPVDEFGRTVGVALKDSDAGDRRTIVGVESAVTVAVGVER